MMRRTIQSLALMLALSAPIYAGEMQFPVASPTPQQATSALQEPGVSGDISNPSATDETAADSFTETVLDLLAGVFGLI